MTASTIPSGEMSVPATHNNGGSAHSSSIHGELAGPILTYAQAVEAQNGEYLILAMFYFFRAFLLVESVS
jgi:hypothetical protein